MLAPRKKANPNARHASENDDLNETVMMSLLSHHALTKWVIL